MTIKTVHGTCVALGGIAALLRGRSGSGKSDLALRFLYLPATRFSAAPALVADDQVVLSRRGDHVIASSPPILAGKIEVRGFGIAQAEGCCSEAELRLVVDLDGAAEIERFPERIECEMMLDVALRRIVLNPFEASAAIKLALALKNLCMEPVNLTGSYP